MMSATSIIQTIEKWYDLLDIPKEWKNEVMNAAQNFDESALAVIESKELPYAYLNEQENKMLCLLYSLYKCEEFYENAKKRGIPDEIIFASLTEVRRYTIEYNVMTKGEKVGLYAINWIGKILNGNIYRLGRLEFEMRDALHSYEEFGLVKGDNVIGVHIPDNGGPFTPEACDEAYVLCEKFFARYFPEYEYKCYVCSSWLLDETLKKFLKPTSNIVRYMDSFRIINTKEVYSALTFLFGRGVGVDDLKDITPTTSLQKSIIEHLNNGGKLYSGFGVKKRVEL